MNVITTNAEQEKAAEEAAEQTLLFANEDIKTIIKSINDGDFTPGSRVQYLSEFIICSAQELLKVTSVNLPTSSKEPRGLLTATLNTTADNTPAPVEL